jgi:NADH-quinone oxidoreductase subunit I
MKSIGRFLKKFFLFDMLLGLSVTLRHYFGRKVTVQYPEKIQEPGARFRGLLRLYRDERGEPLCIACKACQRICPTNCFDIEGLRAEGARIMRPTKFDWTLERCTFCGLCVEVCPTAAIRLSREFRMTSVDKAPLHFDMPAMYVQDEALQEYLCGGCRP